MKCRPSAGIKIKWTQQSGLALIAVLWIITALTVMVASGLARVRTDIQLTHTHVKLVQARALSEAGVYWAIHAILKPRQSVQPGLPDEPLQLNWNDADVSVNIQNEAGKIDINAANERLIEGALVLAGIEKSRASSISGSLHREDDNKFNSVEEFAVQIGIPSDSVQRIMPWLTVHNGQKGINPAAATRDVLLTIPGVNESQIDEYLERRNQNPFHAPDLGFNNRFFTDRLSSVYTITVRSTVDGVSSTTGSLVRLSSTPYRPYEILGWQSSLLFSAS